MAEELLGIHHVTAIAGDPQRNIDFYTGILGLRLVKLTVNFDDPGTYHLYYGDYSARPGTILTFFPWPGARRGRKGTGQTTIFSFLVPQAGLQDWAERLEDYNIPYEGPIARFGDRVLTFFDPDDLQIELVGKRALNGSGDGFVEGPVPANYAIRRIGGVTLAEQGREPTASMLTETLGFRLLQQANNRFRYGIGEGEGETFVDLLEMPGMHAGQVAVGTVHHIAWRTSDDHSQQAWRTALLEAGQQVTPVMDRRYFHSIYFREPGGVLFEIATDLPGFATDESPAELGSALRLPPWLETRRAEIEQVLPPLRLPRVVERV